MRHGPRVALLIVALFAPPGPWAEAQTADVSLKVTVADITGAVLVGARVVVRQPGVRDREASTDAAGVATLEGLTAAPAEILVESIGFEPTTVQDRRLRPGVNRTNVRLPIARMAVTVNVSRDAREKQLDPRGDAFARILGASSIAQLPDDPDELEAAILQMAGPGATIRVNGFGGGRLPPKGQIRQIRFSFNAYSADVHGLGTPMVDIVTQPGSDRWHMLLNAGFRNDALTAGYAYAASPSSEQVHRGGVTLDGPLWRDHTSMSLALDTSAVSDTQTILAATPSGRLTALANRPTDRRGFSVLVEHALTKSHTLRGELTRTAANLENLGVGGANLPERGYSSDQITRMLRLSDSGPLRRNMFNEIRVQTVWSDAAMQSATVQPAIVVLDAFNAGGAQADAARKSWDVELADNVDIARGRHAVRTGILFEGGRYHSIDQTNRLGTFTFSGLDQYVAGTPASFTERVGTPRVDFSSYRAGWYLQDDIKLRKSLMLGAGVRHEVQSHVSGRVNLSPRGGVTWAPLPNGKLVLRGGVGLVYNWFESSAYEQTLRVDGERQYDIVVTHPGFPDPFAGAVPVVLPPSRFVTAADLRLPRIVTTSVAIQHQFNVVTTLTATYTRQRGMELFRGRDVNAPLPDGARPFPARGNVVQVESSGHSRLDRLDVAISRVGMTNGKAAYVLTGYYSLSQSMTDTDGPFALPSDNGNPARDWGPAASDVRHRLLGTASMSLPRGFRALTTVALASAAPYNITTGYDDNHDTVFNDRPAGVGRNSARGAGALDTRARVGWTWGFGRARDSRPGIPNVRRLTTEAQRDPMGALSGPTGDQSHGYRLEFYGQATNILNHVNPIGFRGVLTSPFYGRATASLPPRRIELGLRFDF